MSDAKQINTENEAAEPQPKFSLGKRLLFVGLLVLIALLPFACGELILRGVGYGGYPPVLKEVGTVDGKTYIASSQAGINTFFKQSLNASGTMAPQVLTMPKDPDTVRIFALGGSAMRGYPQPRGLACTSFYEAMLKDVWPDRKIEVLNLGTTAVASFPLMYYCDELLKYEPDLVIVYSGNNEFYGANGVASVHSFGQSTGMMRLHRWLGSFALVQWFGSVIGSGWVGTAAEDPDAANKTLMERVIADGQVPPDDPRRKQAALNLGTHVRYIVDQCTAAKVPVIVCTTPANERDLAPIGEDVLPQGNGSTVKAAGLIAAIVRELNEVGEDTEKRSEIFERHRELGLTDNSEFEFDRGKYLINLGIDEKALEHFTRARDIDPMPWRSLSGVCEAVRHIAADTDMILCDLEHIFREHSPHGCIGWELMDDHVHPSLAGQILIARSWLTAMEKLPEPLRITAEQRAALPDNAAFATQLGANPFDDWAVSHRMRTLLKADFFAKNNSAALDKYQQHCAALEAAMSPAERNALTYWVDQLHKGATRPITGIVGAIYMQQGRYADAQRMLSIAARNVERYSIWELQLDWRAILCGQALHGRPTDVEFELAHEILNDGFTLGRITDTLKPDLMHYLGLAYHTLGDYESAVPYLQGGLPYAEATNSPACLQALADSLLKLKMTGELQDLLAQPRQNPTLEQARQQIVQQLSRPSNRQTDASE